MLPESALSVIYGEPGTGSFVALHMAYSISIERKVFGRRVSCVPVLYVALEGEQAFERRIAATATKSVKSIRFFYTKEPVDLFSGDGHSEAIIRAAQEVDAKFVIIDTLARAMGAGNENDSSNMGEMIAHFDLIRRETGGHVCAVHHSGKDSNRGMRGHSSLLAAVDVALEVKRDGDARTVRVAKSKDGCDGETFAFNLDVFALGKDEDGDLVTSCVVSEIGHVAKVVTLTRSEQGWLSDLIALFAEDGLAVRRIPVSGMTEQLCLTREQVREGFERKGRIDTNADGTVPGSERQKMSKALIALKDKRKIGMSRDHVWLIERRQ